MAPRRCRPDRRSSPPRPRRPAVEPAETRRVRACRAAEPAGAEPAETPAAPGTVSLEQLRDAWPEILEVVQRTRMSAWTVVYTAQARALDGDVLTLSFVSQNDVDSFKQPQGAGEGVSEVLRAAIVEVLGLRVKFIARAEVGLRWSEPRWSEPAGASPAGASPLERAAEPLEPASAGTQPVEDDAPPAPQDEAWAVAAIPDAAPREAAEPADPETAAAASPPALASPAPPASEPARYGESVVRELLGASFVEEQPIAPRVTPQPKGD